MKQNSKNQGFTLIELLVVISIIGLLSSITLVSLNSARAKARDSRRLSDVKQLQTAVELYYDTNGSYPNLIAYIVPLTGQDVNWTTHFQTALNPYFIRLPQDPSGFEYLYSSTNNGQKYGIAVRLETAGNYNLVNNDGGFFNNNIQYYETGESPAACGPSKEWWGDPNNNCP